MQVVYSLYTLIKYAALMSNLTISLKKSLLWSWAFHTVAPNHVALSKGK